MSVFEGRKGALCLLRDRKIEVKRELDKSFACIKRDLNGLFSPQSKRGGNKTVTAMGWINRGLAVYEGVVIGMKLVRGFRGLRRGKK